MIDMVVALLGYFLIYSVPILLFFIADRTKSLSMKKVFIAVGVLFLSAIGGLRNLEVGTDTSETIIRYFDKLDFQSQDLVTFVSDRTIIYTMLSAILKALGLSSISMLFTLQLLCILPITIVAYRKRERIPIAFTMAVYLFLFFQLSFNWIRQSIAASFFLLAVDSYHQNKKHIKGYMLFLLSVLFHSSAVIGIAICIVAIILMRIENKYVKCLIYILTLVLVFLILRQWKNISLWLIDIGILPYSYIGYVNVFSGAHGNSFRGWFTIGKLSYIEYAMRVTFFCLPAVLKQSRYHMGLAQEEQYEENFYCIFAFFGILLYSIAFWGFHTTYGNRLAYYSDVANTVYFGMGYRKSMKTQNRSIVITNLALVVLCVMYNLLLYYFMGWHGTVPYRFSF